MWRASLHYPEFIRLLKEHRSLVVTPSLLDCSDLSILHSLTMSFLQRSTLLLSILTSLVNGAPTTDTDTQGPTPQNLALAQKYAPQFRFHKDEVYFPSTIEFFLAGPVTLYDANGMPLTGAPSPLTDANLATVANQGNGTYLTTNINANLNGFLRGQDPRTSQPTTYTFIAPKANGVVDLYYWIFCPYNLGKKIPLIGYVGDHVGDWERMSVRTVNGVPQSVDYPAHSNTGSGTLPWSQAPKFSPSSPSSPPSTNNSDPNARPISYVALGSHGMWSSAGTFTYVNAVVFQLQDVTTDGGAYWDTANSLTSLEYPDDAFSGVQSWLNYEGEWGNKGVNTCWWFAIHDECELVDGPPGPLRTEMANLKRRDGDGSNTLLLLENLRVDDLPSHVLATVSTGDSSYTFYIDAGRANFIAVEQVCASANATSNADSTPPAPYSYSYGSSYTYTTAANPSGGMAQYTVAVPPCAGTGTSFVSSYSVGLCTTSETQCSFGNRRAIRAYAADPAVLGPQDATAVTVHDLDNWIF